MWIFSIFILVEIIILIPPHQALPRVSKCGNEPQTFWDSTFGECLQIANNDTLLFKCKSDLQCSKSRLGLLSRCSPETGLCECHDEESGGKIPTICYDGICYLKKHLEDFCTEDEECKAGVHRHAVCSKHPSFLPHEKICSCPEGRSCKNLNDNCQTDRECQDGVNRYAVCQFRIGENVCTCKDGHVCELELDEDEGHLNLWEILGIVFGVIVALLLIVVVIVVVLRRRKPKYFV